MCGSRPLQGSKSWVGIELDCQPNRELGLLFGMLTLGHFLVGRGCEPFQGSLRSAFLRSDGSVFLLVLCLHSGVLSPSSLSPSEVDQLQMPT